MVFLRAEQMAMLSMAGCLAAAAASPWLPWRPRGLAQWAASLAAWVLWQRFLASGCRTLTAGRIGKLSNPASLQGQVWIVTGAGVGGIGFWTAADLLSRGATVIVTARKQSAADAAAAQLKAEVSSPLHTGANAHGMALQLSDPRGIESFVEDVAKFLGSRTLSGLMNNAGAMQPTPVWTACAGDGSDGTHAKVEVNVATNQLGPHMLTQLLLPYLAGSKAVPARIVFVASQAHRKVTDVHTFLDRSASAFGRVAGTPITFAQQFEQYGLSKLGNMGDGVGFSSDNVVAVSLHPGVAWGTNVVNDVPIAKKLAAVGLKNVVLGAMMMFMKTPLEAAYTSIYCCTTPTLVPGGYYVDETEATASQVQGAANSGDRTLTFRRLHEWTRTWVAKWSGRPSN